MPFFITLNKFANNGTHLPLMFASGLYQKIPDWRMNQPVFKYTGLDQAIFNGHVIKYIK